MLSNRQRNRSQGSGQASRPFLGWRIARAGLFIQVIHSGLVFNAFTLFSAQLKSEFGWSNSVFGFAFAMNRAESGLLGPVQGWMTDRYGPRFVLRLGAVVMAVGFVAFSTISSVAGFYLTYLLVAMGSSLGGFITITVAIVHWFEKKRARALALSSMGFAIGGALAFCVGIGIDSLGWRRTAQLSAVVSIIVILWLARLFERKPSDVGQFVDGVDPSTTTEAEAVGVEDELHYSTPVHFTASEAIKTRAFWFISLGHASALLVVGAVMAHLANFLNDETSLSGLHIAIVIGVLPAMMGVGQLLGGFLGDLYNKRWLITVAMFGHCLGFLALAGARGPILIWIFVLLHGLAWGLRAPLQQAMRADYFGATDFGKIMGYSALIVMTGMMTGPIVAGVLADVTGSFRTGFTILALAAGLGSLWFWFARPPAQPQRNQAQA